MAQNDGSDQQAIADNLMNVVETILKKKGQIAASKPPECVQREIIEYEGRMRVFGLEKFNGPCFISSINFYFNEQELENKNACGVMIVYIEEENTEKLLKALGYKGYDEEDDGEVMNICGEFCDEIAGQFKEKLKSAGLADLQVSNLLTYKNDIPDGVEFKYSEKKLHEINFILWKTKTLVIDITMSA